MDVTWQQLKSAGAAFDKQEAPQQVAGHTAEQPKGFDFVGIAKMGIVQVCDFLGHSQRLGEHWKTTPEEAEGLAVAIDDVMPDDFAVGKWGALAIAVTAFAAPRAAITMMNKNKSAPQEKPHAKPQTQPQQAPAIEHKQPKESPAAQAVSSRNN